MIFLDYEQYYEARFGKVPRVVKKIEDKSGYEQLKKMAMRQKQLNATINNTGTTKVADQPTPPLPPSKRSIQHIQRTSRRGIQSMRRATNLLRTNRKLRCRGMRLYYWGQLER
jgi:hypothetical protein